MYVHFSKLLRLVNIDLLSYRGCHLYVCLVNAPFFGLHLFRFPFFSLSFSLHVVCYTQDCPCMCGSAHDCGCAVNGSSAMAASSCYRSLPLPLIMVSALHIGYRRYHCICDIMCIAH